MNVEMINRTIQLILAPVLMISTSALLQAGWLGHYTAISGRIRALNRERLDLLFERQQQPERLPSEPVQISTLVGIHSPDVEEPSGYQRKSLMEERIREIDQQLTHLLARHKLAHLAALAVYAAIVLFAIDMLIIGAAVLTDTGGIATSALAVFLLAVVIFLLGVITIAVEIRSSHWVIQFEVNQVLALGALPE